MNIIGTINNYLLTKIYKKDFIDVVSILLLSMAYYDNLL